MRRGQVHPVYALGVNRTHEFFDERQFSIIKWSRAMLSKTRIALSFAIVWGAGSCASAAVMQEASNHASQYSNPADAPNGPFLYVDTYGVPPVQRHAQQPHHPPRRHN
jgi:hypothetical protein